MGAAPAMARLPIVVRWMRAQRACLRRVGRYGAVRRADGRRADDGARRSRTLGDAACGRPCHSRRSGRCDGGLRRSPAPGMPRSGPRSERSLPCLPPSGPDLDPIEKAFAKLEAMLRKGAARSVDTPWRRIRSILDSVTPGACASRFAAAGHEPARSDSAPVAGRARQGSTGCRDHPDLCPDCREGSTQESPNCRAAAPGIVTHRGDPPAEGGPPPCWSFTRSRRRSVRRARCAT